MTQQVKEKLVRIDFVEKEQKKLNKQVEREKFQAKMGDFLIKLSKEYKPVKKDLQRILKKAELNAKYLELTVSIQKIKYQIIYWINGIY